MKPWHLLIISIILIAMELIDLYLLISYQPIKSDEHSRELALVIPASIFGIFLIIAKEAEGADRVLIESFEVLAFIVIASIATFPLLSNPIENIRYGAVLLMLTSGGWWGFYVGSRFIKENEKEESKNEDANTLKKRVLTRFWLVTIIFAFIWALGIDVLVIGSHIT